MGLNPSSRIPFAIYFSMGEWSEKLLAGLKDWTSAHNAVIMTSCVWSSRPSSSATESAAWPGSKRLTVSGQTATYLPVLHAGAKIRVSRRRVKGRRMRSRSDARRARLTR